MMDICKCREVGGTRLQTGIPTSPAMLWMTQLFPLKNHLWIDCSGGAEASEVSMQKVLCSPPLPIRQGYQVVCYPTEIMES